MVKHQEKHPFLDVEGCYGCRIAGVRFGVSSITRERNGEGPGKPGQTNREYVHEMYATRRAAGLEDPIPENRKAAAYAPATGKYF